MSASISAQRSQNSQRHEVTATPGRSRGPRGPRGFYLIGLNRFVPVAAAITVAMTLLSPMVPALVLVSVYAAPAVAMAQTNSTKTIQGKVFDHGETPLPGGIVYLQDQKTNIVKTFIATADGTYRFGELPPDTDYKIWAVYKDQKSKSRLVSSFDTKLIVSLDFHVGS
jgi:hypothetical protein